jgi:MFS family permease
MAPPAIAPPPTTTSLNDRVLFAASFLTLIAAGIGASVRGVILIDWGQNFGFTQSELGTISGGGFIGFGVAIIFFSFFADLFGYGKLMLVAFLLHVASAVVTFAAAPVYAAYGKEGAFICLSVGLWLFALGNGTCEAVINPLTATLFPNNKTHWLNILHAGWPLGLMLGVVITLAFKQFEGPGASFRWEYKLGVFLVPVVMYGLLMFNRVFPRSEAETAGVPLQGMMGRIGMIGFAVPALFLAFALPTLLGAFGLAVPGYVGYILGGLIWVAFTVACGFSFGSFLLAFLYLMHALVGYVELGTDGWITNIASRVLKSETNAQVAFFWTSLLMFGLRFTAGPIVHRINPIGLLLVSALCGTAGLALMGMPFTNTFWLWMGAVTIYALGKTFYWPTLLGVVSERFPRGGALALGLSGGIGMISAGFFGSAGIGYKQDYLAVEKIKELSPATYERYKSGKANDFPVVTELAPQLAPPIAGFDNKKVKVFEDYKAAVEGGLAAPRTTLDKDFETMGAELAAGKDVGEELQKDLRGLKTWWEAEGRPHYSDDKVALSTAQDYGARTALLYTAAVPGALAVGFLLLLLYFAAIGGYKPVHIDVQDGPAVAA